MFWKIYAGVVTFVAVGMYVHIRKTEGCMEVMQAVLDAQLKAERNSEEIKSED